MRAEVVVVGGGVIGLSVALFTARRTDPLREPVVLLERATPGSGASGRSSALIWQQDEDRCLARMARDGLRHYAGFERQTGRSVGFRGVGALTILEPGAGSRRAELEQRSRELGNLGIRLELLEAPELRRRFPLLEVEPDALATWEPDAGHLDVELAFEATGAVAKNAGAVLRPGAETSGLIVEDGRIVGVSTPSGRIEARKVVVAAGPWSAELLAQVGVHLPLLTRRTREHQLAAPGLPGAPLPAQAPLHADAALSASAAAAAFAARAGAAAAEFDRRFAHSQDEPAAGFTHPVLVDRALDLVVHCEPAHGRTFVRRLRRAGEPMADPDAPQPPVEDAFRAWARETLARRLPLYRSQPDLDSRAGWTTASPDGRPIVGAVPGIAGLFVATALADDAFRLAPSIAEGLSQQLSDHPPSAYDPALFSPERFA